jgi:hypothetical protein
LLASVAAQAADPPAAPAAVLKTKTNSNQPNDRTAAPAPAAADETPATAPPTEVQKNKTRSNQSND